MLKGSWPRIAGGSLLRDWSILQRSEWWGRRRRGGRQDTCHSGTVFQSVFRIHDILVWIRIRIHRSMLLTNGSGFWSGSCYFFHRTFTSFLKDKVQNKSHNSRNQYLSYYFCLIIEGSGSIPLTSGSESGSVRPKNMWIWWIRIRTLLSVHREKFKKSPVKKGNSFSGYMTSHGRVSYGAYTPILST